MKKLNIVVILLLIVLQTVLSPISVFASEADASIGVPGTTETKEEPAVKENGANAIEGAGVSEGAAEKNNSVDSPQQLENPSAPKDNPSTLTENPSAPIDNTSTQTDSPSAPIDNSSTQTDSPNAPTDKSSTLAEESKTVGEDSNAVKPEQTQTNTPPVGKARELSHTGFLDSVKIAKTDLSYGEQTGVHVTFSEKPDVKLNTGDTITMTLPHELKGFNTTIKLEDYGSCDVTNGQVVCTFNSKVEEREKITGFFNFSILGTNVEAGITKTVHTNFGTDLTEQAVTITHPNGSSTPGVFFYKSGDIIPEKADEVRWFLNFNLKLEQLDSDIVLHDYSKGGQQIKKDSFNIQTSGQLGKHQFTPEAFESNGYGYVKFTSDNTFDVVIKKEFASLSSFTVSYNTTITAEGVNEKYLKNEYDLTYKVNNQDEVHEKNVEQVKNISANGWAEGILPEKGTLRILKHIDGNKEQVIPGVQFKVFKSDGQQIGDLYTTDAKGIVEVPNLKTGEYYVQEISAPEYVTFDANKKIPFTIDASATNGVELPIGNSLKKTSIEGTKTWNNDREQDRPTDIKVDLLKDDKVIATKVVTAENGWKYSFENLDQYTVDGKEIKYAVKEQPVAGYESKVEGYNIVNTKILKGSIVLTKINADTKDKLAGVEFTLIDNEGKVIAEKLVTDKDGQIKVDNLRPGKYAFVETKALFGYKPLHEKMEFTIENDQKEDVQVTVENSYNKTTVVLTKHAKDEQGPVLPNAEFKLINQKGEVIVLKLVTDKDGQIKVDNLSPGKYAFVETQAPKGYQLDAKPIDFEVSLVDKESVIQLKAFNQAEPTEKPTTPEKPVGPSEKPTTPEKPVGPSEKPTTPEKPVGPSEKPTTPEKPVEPSEKPKPQEKPEKPVESEKTYEPKYEGKVVEEPKPQEKSETSVEQSEKPKDSKNESTVVEEPKTQAKTETSMEQSKKLNDSKNVSNAVEMSSKEQANNVAQNQKVDKKDQSTPNQAERLPQTGESNTTLYQVLGLILVALAYLLFRRNRKEI
ncbi:SpaA isopeptide-forming pilin-related protein [Lysinibacillus sp. G4S2]|uniref:SpaA isopeptide-forming pilin-related protein n=1 Tax=Lysinibacillus sp. G4S2 TaxID=3055859 RepID=UPI0025A14E8F|nr:SpaA isopeptide-forming pilin-related protein [Lysinibacillus sp. G4S2]MDM5250061.1 SpaA isopeptide-forming pilin-related protein [Lysinibacillus sp. G4S2]